MGTFDHGPAVGPQKLDERHENPPRDGGTLTAETSVVSVDESSVVSVELIDNHLADNDLLVAMTPISSDILANIEHTLDQLTSTTDLFDVSAFDLDSAPGS
jgi:hypothetical protein